ncbi:gamma-glutamylcyclotransferase family protein [Marinithermus hydrothermalis]|uniref:AIG2 family protein n=1 Tax=Marinithermus hydrothermalis (strain DSM 14884 / JCM 11576 / T1) TaxID=869210 RepID=F2NL69_MARHT|nr:gamma-glutamylcyclotransferase family protein [Marinithermus hydrothermalis]AEB11472.1 AIG2 family protein [Marinithermus hydrothermalis DSM 14884]
MEPVGVFVYGTLRVGERNFPVARQAGWVASEPAVLEGFVLYDLPYGYPAIVRGAGRVYGEVQYYRDLARALERLDVLEDVGAEYLRVRVEVQVRGERVGAWAYVYPNLEAVRAAGGRRVPSGRWTGGLEAQ